MQNLKIKLYNKTAALSWSLTPVLPVVVFVVASLLFAGSQTALATGSIQPQSTFPDTSDYDYPPDSVATDAAGNVYVAYSGEPVIRKYDSAGSLITNISVSGSPSGLAIDLGGDIFVEDGDTGSIKKYDSAGVLQTEWGSMVARMESSVALAVSR